MDAYETAYRLLRARHPDPKMDDEQHTRASAAVGIPDCTRRATGTWAHGGGVDPETGLSQFALKMAGVIVLALPQHTFATHYIRATFKLRIGGGGGAERLSFSYGDLPAGNIGELGARGSGCACTSARTRRRASRCGTAGCSCTCGRRPS
jgi:hypothetical protein